MVAAMAHHELLDEDLAEINFSAALDESRKSAEAMTYLTRLFAPLLGELLYERGDLVEPRRMLDESAALGEEGGVCDYMIATFAVGARVDALLGADPLVKLDAGMKIARTLGTRRLEAAMNRERVRFRLAPEPQLIPDPDDELILALINELVLETTIYQHLAAGRPLAALSDALRLYDGIDRKRRPRVGLAAYLLLSECRLANGEEIDIVRTIETCASKGLVRPLIDTGPRLRDYVLAQTDLPDEAQRLVESAATLPSLFNE